MPVNERPQFVTLGMFIIDEFEFRDEDGKPTGKVAKSQVGHFINKQKSGLNRYLNLRLAEGVLMQL